MSTSSGSSRPPQPLGLCVPNPKLRFLECREVLRFKQMARRTEEAYVDWIRRFIVWARNHPHLTPLPSLGGSGEGENMAASAGDGDGGGESVPHVSGGVEQPTVMALFNTRFSV